MKQLFLLLSTFLVLAPTSSFAAKADLRGSNITSEFYPVIIPLYSGPNWEALYEQDTDALDRYLYELSTAQPKALVLGELQWVNHYPSFQPDPKFLMPGDDTGQYTADLVEFAAFMAFMDGMLGVEPVFGDGVNSGIGSRAGPNYLPRLFEGMFQFNGFDQQEDFLIYLAQTGWTKRFHEYLQWYHGGQDGLNAARAEFLRWHDKINLRGEEELTETEKLLWGVTGGAPEGVDLGGWGMAGEIWIGFVPIAGQAIDIKEAKAAIDAFLENPNASTAAMLALAGVAIIPGGDAAKAGSKASKVNKVDAAPSNKLEIPTITSPKLQPDTYSVLDGVRQSKAADLTGKQSIRAEVYENGVHIEIKEIPIKKLLSPKESINLSNENKIIRFSELVQKTKNGEKLPEIKVISGSDGVHIKSVEIKFGK
ncbi:MAG: hypothetical protein H8E27_02795 [Verrucomicrobia subdivision 3 bacterium]|nr:hypothetical protein [Limisphaerales bacterium]